MIRQAVVIASVSAGLLAIAAPPAVAAAPAAGCVGQFFASHAGLVPATDGAEVVGAFVAPTAGELRPEFGAVLSTAARTPDRSNCAL